MDERDAFDAWRDRHGVPSSFELLRRDNGCSCPVPWQGAEPCPWCQPPFSELLGDVSPAPGGDAPFRVYEGENEGIVWDPSPEPVRVDLLHTLRDGMRAAFGPPRSDNLICGHCGEKMLPGRTIAHSMICPGPGSSSEKAAEIAALSGRKLTAAVLSKWAASPGGARDGSSFDDDRPCPRCNQPIPPGGAIEHWRDCLSRPSPFRVIRGGKS
jgi:hypothetical protein